jgi:hypothetical protein
VATEILRGSSLAFPSKTETSTPTPIGVPALAYANYAPEQAAITPTCRSCSVMIARIIISLLHSRVFQRQLLTAYELLRNRFGVQAKNFASYFW